MPIVFDQNHRLFLPGTSNVTFGKRPLPNEPWALLGYMTDYLKNNMSSLRNPNFYNYRLDGDEYYIGDGGGDMYDAGNYTLPWLLDNTDYSQNSGNPGVPTVSYAVNESTIFDNNFYYQSLGYIQYNWDEGYQNDACLPLTVLGSRQGTGDPIGWQVCGNSGADGNGDLSSSEIYTGQTLHGFTVHAFYRETYSAGDPSHCNLFILMGHSAWNTNFGTINSYAQPTNAGGNGAYYYCTGGNVKNVLAIQTLLSKNGGNEVTAGECQTVVQNFASNIRLALGY